MLDWILNKPLGLTHHKTTSLILGRGFEWSLRNFRELILISNIFGLERVNNLKCLWVKLNEIFQKM